MNLYEYMRDDVKTPVNGKADDTNNRVSQYNVALPPIKPFKSDTMTAIKSELEVAQKIRSEPRWEKEVAQLPELAIDASHRLHYLLDIRHALSIESAPLSQVELQLASTLTEYLADDPLLNQLLEQRLVMISRDDKNYLPLKIQQAQCLAKMGLLEQAYSLLELELIANPFDNNLLRAISDIQQLWQAIPYALIDCRSEKLMLVPLTQDYLNDFCWLYEDSSIRELCNLPDFTSDEEWLSWLNKCNRSVEQQLFAVLHKDWGFIGSVSIEIYHGVGFFYYWLGGHFQGLGYGPQAVDILLNLAEKYLSMDCCYAKVYQHNQRSHKAMAKLGFSPLTIKAKSPYDNESFYYSGPKKSNWDNYRELEWLLQVQDSMTELAGPEGCLYTGWESLYLMKKL